MNLDYRKDIDGLRGTAVLLVILGHLNIHRFVNGFLGVDIFFVISGFLISTVIFKELNQGNFSLISFFERRMRRILPALFALLIFCSFFSFIFLFPIDLISFSKSALATMFSVSNFYFSQIGYFTTIATTKPLLHTWSLGVEEQFYILFPLVCICIFRFIKKKQELVIFSLLLMSFLMYLYLGNYNQTGAFYLPYTRMWELLIGVLLFFFTKRFSIDRKKRELCAIGGSTILVIELFFLSNTSLMLLSLFSCFASALFIFAHSSGNTIISKILSSKPLVFTGLISYSLYLWHWPFVVFSNFLPIYSSNLLLKNSIIFSLSYVFAILSWKFVEQPFRNEEIIPKGRFFKIILLATVLIASFQYYFLLSDGFASRFPSSVLHTFDYAVGPNKKVRSGSCLVSSVIGLKDFNKFNTNECLKLSVKKKNYLLLGDSHAAEFYKALSLTYPNINILQATATGCQPKFDGPMNENDSCTSLMRYIRDIFLVQNHVEGILLSEQWQNDHGKSLPSILEWAQKINIPVIVFGPNISYKIPYNRIVALATIYHDPSILDKYEQEGLKEFDTYVSKITQAASSTYISIYKETCPQEQCIKNIPSGAPLIYDSNHFSFEASLFIIKSLLDKKILNL